MTRLEDNVIRGADSKGGACSFSEFGSYAFGTMVIDSVCKRGLEIDPRDYHEVHRFQTAG